MKKEQNCDCTVAFLPKMLRKQHFGGESHCTITILFFFHVQSGARLYNNYAANSVTQDKYSSEEEFKKAVAEIHKTYQCVFQGVGRYHFHTVDLKLKPGSEPFILRAILVPLHCRKPATQCLEEFVRLKILEPLPIGYATLSSFL